MVSEDSSLSGAVDLRQRQLAVEAAALTAVPIERPSTRTPQALVIGLIGLSLANGLGQNTQPLINGRWQEELSLSSTAAGGLLTVQILVGAVVGIVLSTRLHQISPRRLGLAAYLVLVLANLAMAFAVSYPWLVASCAVGGAAVGCIGACIAAAVATSSRVDRTSAIVAIAATLLVAAMTLLAGRLTQFGGREALFLGQAGMFVGGGLLTAILPERHAGASADRSTPLFAAIRSPVVLSFIGFNVAATGVWTFAERIGAHLGVTATVVGDTLAAGTVLAVTGAVLAATVARPGREKAWALVGVGTFGLTTILLGMAWSRPVFLFAILALCFTFVFAMPFLTAVAVKQDRSGGLAAAMTGWGTLVGAGAPVLAGFLVRDGSYANLAWMSAGATIFAVAAMMFVRSPGRGSD